MNLEPLGSRFTCACGKVQASPRRGAIDEEDPLFLERTAVSCQMLRKLAMTRDANGSEATSSRSDGIGLRCHSVGRELVVGKILQISACLVVGTRTNNAF